VHLGDREVSQTLSLPSSGWSETKSGAKKRTVPLEGVNNSVWIDGVQFAKDDTIMFKMPGFTEVRVGWTHFAHNDPDPFTDIWFDDIAFGPERIGCK